MTARLWELWRQWSGLAMAERTAYTKGFDAGFREGMNLAHAAARGAGFIKGFTEGRESTRTIPLDTGNVPLDDEEQGPWNLH